MPTLSETVRKFCIRKGIRLNTDLGQHFLVDEPILKSIIDAGRITQQEHILEIGAGLGILTKELLQKAKHVTTIEIDTRWIPLMKEYIGEKLLSHLTILEGNALQIPFPKEPYKIVANIPYHITSPLLRHAFLESPKPPESLTLLIQREVAEKICDTKDAGLLTIVVGLFGTPRLITRVPPTAFLPPPKVDSAVLHIDCFPSPLADAATIDATLTLVKLAFSQKRKMLSNTIGKLPEGMALLVSAGIEATRRPQTLSVQEWIELAKKKL